MGFLDASRLSLSANLAIFLVAAGLVWASGTQLSRNLHQIAGLTGIGKAFTGMLLLGGITSLPEVATVTTASYSGNVALATNNLLGSVAINVLLLALADAVLGRDALSSVVPGPAALLQGTLNILVLALTAGAIVAGDILIFGVGVWSAGLLTTVVAGMWLVARYEGGRRWQIVGPQEPGTGGDEAERPYGRPPPGETLQRSLRQLLVGTVVAAVVILAAGFALAETGDAIATKTGLGSTMVGFLLVGFATSLPEISSIVAAIRVGAYELAIGDVFGTNLFDIALIFLADLVYTGDSAVLGMAGRFENFAVILGMVLTGIYLLGLLEREDRTVLRMGYDSLAVILTFGAGMVGLYLLQRG